MLKFAAFVLSILSLPEAFTTAVPEKLVKSLGFGFSFFSENVELACLDGKMLTKYIFLKGIECQKNFK